MQALEEAIREMGQGVGHQIVKVDRFLNHRIDTALMMRMGQEIAARFADSKPDLVMTIEASGIALGLAAAVALGNIPLVFCKKSGAKNQSERMLYAAVRSFTRGTTTSICCDPEYIPAGSRVLLVDDFLAEGEAMHGMLSLVNQAGAAVAGAAVAIEKSFQPGGRRLREGGIPLLSLAVIDEIRDGQFHFASL